MGHAILTEVVLVMAVAVAAAALLRRIHVPPVVGFIIAGIAIGPGGFALVDDRHQIEILAEVGVILLLFTVGLKLKMGDVWRLRGAVFGGGALQVALTGGAVILLDLALGMPADRALVWGAMAALSSTALVVWLLEGSGDIHRPHGRVSIAFLLFQDLAVVPIMLALPLIAGQAATPPQVAGLLGRSVLVLAATVAAARLLFPWITRRIVATGSRELFTLTTVLVAVGTALVFAHFGLSAALGAFLAGMVVSESEYVGRMVDEITPLRDVFNGLFFVSLGMLVNPRIWLEHPVETLGLAALVVVIKGLLSGLAALAVLRRPIPALAAGLGLAQVGEFSIVIAVEAGRLGVFDGAAHNRLMAVVVPTLLVTPFLARFGWGRARRTGVSDDVFAHLTDHVVIVGAGPSGRHVARALSLVGVPHVTVDLNPYTVESLGETGELALEGDAGRTEVLAAAGMARGRGLVCGISDAAATRQVVRSARSLNATATILARTRFIREVDALTELGANQVVPEELETSLELAGRVLRLYGASEALIRREKNALRREGYGLLRGTAVDEHPDFDALSRLGDIHRVTVASGSTADGSSLAELNVRRATGATVLAVVRGDLVLSNPAPDLDLHGGDVLVCFADETGCERVSALLAAPPGSVS